VVSPECSLKDNVLYCGAQKVATYSTTCYYFDDHKRCFKNPSLEEEAKDSYFVVRIYDRDGQAIVFKK